MAEQHTFPFSFKHRFPEWQTEFEAVLLEGDSQKLSQRVEVAEAAIRLRLKSVVNSADGNIERVAISDARRLMALVQDVDSLLETKLNWHNNNRPPDQLPSGPGVLTALSGWRADYNPCRPFEKLLLNVAEDKGLISSAKHEAAPNLNCHEETNDPSGLKKNLSILRPSKMILSHIPESEFPNEPTLTEPSAVHQGLNPGDRVEGVGNFGKPLGEFGTVEQANDDEAIVKWDDDGRMTIRQPWLQKIQSASKTPRIEPHRTLVAGLLRPTADGSKG